MADINPYIGSIALFAGNFAPKGYALCAGQLLPISQNTALFSILGTTYGGDGRVTFALPDLRGRAPIGQGQGQGLNPIALGQAAGTPQTTLLSNQLPAHNHQIKCDGNASDGGAPGPSVVLGTGGDAITPVNLYSGNPPNASMSPMAMGPSGGNQPFPVQNPYLGLNFIIALQGLFPPRD